MGWYTHYNIILNAPIVDFDYDFVDSWCSENGVLCLNYMDRIVDVTIKYGRYEIDDVLSMLEDKFSCVGYITVVRTDELEWPGWREHYEAWSDYSKDGIEI